MLQPVTMSNHCLVEVVIYHQVTDTRIKAQSASAIMSKDRNDDNPFPS